MSDTAASSAIFQSVYDAYPDGVLVVDGDGHIVLANPAAYGLLGYPPGGLLGLSVDALVPLAVAPRHGAYRQSYAQTPRSRPMGSDLELRALRADGSEVMVEIALSPLSVGEGAQARQYVVASVRGIAAYPRMRRALQRAQYNEFVVQLGRVAVNAANAEELLQCMPGVVLQALDVQAVGVALVSADGLALQTASYAGVQADLAGHAAHANLPHTWPGFVVSQGLPIISANLALEQRFEVPQRVLQAGGRSGLAVPLTDRGRVVGVLGAWSDQERRFGEEELAFFEALASLLSTSLQRTQTEAQLRHAQRMRSVGQLTGGIAHDFNNLLTVIQGNLQILADQPAVQADALARQLVAAAMRAGQRGADLTGKLLAFSRRQPLAAVPIDPATLLHNLGELLRRTLGEKIRVRVIAPPGLPNCLADPVQLESALLNVAINARDAMQEAGVALGLLTLRCGAGPLLQIDPAGPGEPAADAPSAEEATVPGALDGVSAEVDAAAGLSQGLGLGVWFSIEDNGCGMSPAVRDRAFEPFFTTKPVGHGTGLGLSTVYGFVKQSRGSIRIDSTPGQGSTVTLILPAQTAPEALPASAPAELSLAPGLRVLLVEDDADVREVAQSFLRALACQVYACADAPAALAYLGGGETPDLLFSDVMLGEGQDGMTLARQALARLPGLAVVLCSGYSRHWGQDGQPSQPGWPVLRKPYTKQELTQAIVQALHAPHARARSG